MNIILECSYRLPGIGFIPSKLECLRTLMGKLRVAVEKNQKIHLAAKDWRTSVTVPCNSLLSVRVIVGWAGDILEYEVKVLIIINFNGINPKMVNSWLRDRSLTI